MRGSTVMLITGVPVSTQWESQGYFYPTQIAQFGLAHYSKNLTEPEPRRKVLEDGSGVAPDWLIGTGSIAVRSADPPRNSLVLKFQTSSGKSCDFTTDTEHSFILKGTVNMTVQYTDRISGTFYNSSKKNTK